MGFFAYRKCISTRYYHRIANDFRFRLLKQRQKTIWELFHRQRFINPIYKHDLSVSRLIFRLFIAHPTHNGVERVSVCQWRTNIFPSLFYLVPNRSPQLIEFIAMSNEKP